MWQVARNCLIDHQRKGANLQPSAYENELVESKASSVAEIRMNGSTEERNGLQVTTFQYAGKPVTNERRRLTTSVSDAEWQHIEKTEASPGFEAFVDERSAEQCVSEGLDAFSKQEPERAYVLMLQMDGSSVDEIGQLIGRTVAATKEYLSQCKKKIQPFIAHCNELLSA
jgi:DNA-directed RNA polymerase specialized sigma24 family protein